MRPLQSGFSCALILFLSVSLYAVDCGKVIVGDQFIFPETCEPSASGTLLRVLWDGGIREVAAYQSGGWTVSREYRDRMKIISSKIAFIHTLFTDGGVYELSCSKPGIKENIQLEVVVAWKESVTEDQNVILLCYFETSGKPGLTVRWEKNGKPLCLKNSNASGCSGTPADRLSVSKDWLTHGDLSLTIEKVQPGDRGDYFCYVQDLHEKKSGNPAAVRLTVNEKKSHQITSTATPRNQTQSCAEQTQPWKISTWVLSGILLLLLILVALVCLCHHGKLCCDSKKMYKVVRSYYSSHPNEDTTSV